ncbi:hypothetical protein OHB07_06110 [Streptomyces sp. NBC_00111]|uniref:hypothetical protein n=1 Tax=Streptomyces sp. NBC_00111 TaxID=2975655 RepID=UPI00324E7496
MNIRQSLKILLTGTISIAALSLGTTTASATNDDANYFEGCSNPDTSGFKFKIHYNSGQNGAYRYIGYAVYNFDAIDVTDGNPQGVPLKFCVTGGSAPAPGSGQRIKNNAASAENFHYKYMARVYFSSGYKGAQDVMGPGQHIDQFRNVYNENASFQWTS